jgi:hypothetical protein
MVTKEKISMEGQNDDKSYTEIYPRKTESKKEKKTPEESQSDAPGPRSKGETAERIGTAAIPATDGNKDYPRSRGYSPSVRSCLCQNIRSLQTFS